MIEVACVSIKLRVAVTEDGQELPITVFMDSAGDDCEPEEAVSVVAGPDHDGLWVHIDLSAFDNVRLN